MLMGVGVMVQQNVYDDDDDDGVMGGALRVPFTGLNLCDVSPMLRHPRDTQMCNYFEIYAFFVSTKREIVDLCVFLCINSGVNVIIMVGNLLFSDERA